MSFQVIVVSAASDFEKAVGRALRRAGKAISDDAKTAAKDAADAAKALVGAGHYGDGDAQIETTISGHDASDPGGSRWVNVSIRQLPADTPREAATEDVETDATDVTPQSETHPPAPPPDLPPAG